MKIIKPVFWSEKNFLSLLLYPLTVLTFLINLIKKFSVKKKFSIKTICIGNICVGGTGKTPLSIKIDKILKKKYKTVFVKKKYSDQSDEQSLLRSNGNLICTNYRDNGLKIAQKLKYDVAIMDDGLQEKSIKYDLTIACFNTSEGIGNGLLLPAGPLRENISAIKNYDAIFLNGEKKNKKLFLLLKKINNNLKIFEGKYVPLNIKNFNRNKKFIIFSGLGNPEEYERTLKKYKFKIKEKFVFPDHHKFSNSEIKKIKKIAKNNKLEIITTEKDYFRLNNKNKKNIKFLKVNLQIKNIKKFSRFLEERL
jgi:tetraacyldisaccharide 4'-kinase|tara:strand:- start:995 stop:1918 length:924 start_codon:yes stop_codon:yes gene_type:complete